LIQFLPRPWQRKYNSMFGRHLPKGEIQELALLSAGRLRRLFPTSHLAKVRVTFWPETLVAYCVDPGRQIGDRKSNEARPMGRASHHAVPQ